MDAYNSLVGADAFCVRSGSKGEEGLMRAKVRAASHVRCARVRRQMCGEIFATTTPPAQARTRTSTSANHTQRKTQPHKTYKARKTHKTHRHTDTHNTQTHTRKRSHTHTH